MRSAAAAVHRRAARARVELAEFRVQIGEVEPSRDHRALFPDGGGARQGPFVVRERLAKGASVLSEGSEVELDARQAHPKVHGVTQLPRLAENVLRLERVHPCGNG